MIYGIGTDIVNIERITALYKKDPHRLVQRILGQSEQKIIAQIKLESKKVEYLAKRFAGKEAVSKALGTGIAHGLNFADIEILNNDEGQPYVKINQSAAVSKKIQDSQIQISLSDDAPFAVAFVVIERYSQPR